MTISWGTKIAILYIGFVVMIGSLVAGTFFKKSDLVSEDYYAQEIGFQHRLDATNAATALKEPLSVTLSGEEVLLRFPQSFTGKAVKADVHFYAPANAAADRRVSISTANAMLEIPRTKLAPAAYDVQVSWSAEGKDYFQSRPLNLLQ